MGTAGGAYLLQLVGCIHDVQLPAAEQSVDQLLNHICLLMDDGQVQRTVGKRTTFRQALWFLGCADHEQGRENSRVPVAVLDATELSLDCQQDPGVPGAAVLQQGGGGLSGTLRGSAVEGGG